MQHQDRWPFTDVEMGQAKVTNIPVAGLESKVRESFESLLGRAKDARRRMRGAAMGPKGAP